jgi:hypothetical protein
MEDTKHTGRAVDTSAEHAKQAAEDRAQRIGEAAQKFNEYHTAYGIDHRLETEEIAAAVYLELLNIREYYPERLGGTAAFDKICADTVAWFNTNKTAK